MLTQPPFTGAPPAPPAPPAQPAPHAPDERPDDLSGRTHRQVIGYLGLALPILLVQAVRLRPNPPSDQWYGGSISAYYWTGAVSLFVGLLAALSLFLLTYRGYANETHKYDRGAAIIAGIAAALVAIFPASPPPGIIRPPPGVAPLPWWHDWIGVTHQIAAIVLFSMFAIFSLWLFRQSASGEQPSADKKRRNAIYLLCGSGILASMAWAVVAGFSGRSIFWPESLALIFFAWSWLTKGRALHSVKATLGGA